jgi:hypothetical protein
MRSMLARRAPPPRSADLRPHGRPWLFAAFAYCAIAWFAIVMAALTVFAPQIAGFVQAPSP